MEEHIPKKENSEDPLKQSETSTNIAPRKEEATQPETKKEESIPKKEKAPKEPFDLGKWHDQYYKLILIIPIALMVFAIGYQFMFYQQNGDIIQKDISLTGGTSITINEPIDAQALEIALAGQLEELNTRVIYDIISQEQIALIVQTRADADVARQALEEYLGYELTDENASFEFTGSTLSEGFYRQLLVALVFAFVLMTIVVFILFRSVVPSAAVIISAFADIFMTLVAVNVLGMQVSSAGIVAFLMLIGYSVDTDILLTNRLLKRHDGTLNERLIGALKTGLTMTLTSLIAVSIAFYVVKSFSPTLAQIFAIISIGLVFDIINTWTTNASILKWYLLGGKTE